MKGSPRPLRPLRRRRASWYVSDNCYDTLETRALRSGLWNSGDFNSAQKRLQSCQDANERAHIAEACADWYAKPEFLDDWVEALPKSASAVLVRGIHGVKWGWRARGAAWTPNNFPEFQARLKKAETDLLTAAERAPKDPVPWAWLIVCYRGMQEPGSGEDAFENAVKLSPKLRVAYSHLLVNKLPQWYGSRQEATDFAWESLNRGPKGIGIETVLCEAYVFAPSSVPEGNQTWADDHVRKSVIDMNKRYFGASSFVETPDSLRNRNWFAYALWKTGQLSMAKEHMQHLGSVPQVFPWGQAQPFIEWLISRFKKCRRECRRA